MRQLAPALLAVMAVTGASHADDRGQPPPRFASHPPMRPLATPSDRPKAAGTAHFVDPKLGDDAADGTDGKPWKTIARAVKQATPGETIFLRGGTYYETVAISVTGRPDAPITLRAAPGELAILDGGLREFAEAPATAWEPVTGGAPGEYRSTKAYADLGPGDRGVAVLGNFADSMVPLHGYKFDADLRAANPYWNVVKDAAGTGIYVGPGVWLDPKTHRIHIRLARTTLNSQPNYQGETDPRKLALVIAGARTPLRIAGSKHLRIQDLVVRGSAARTVELEGSDHVDLDGMTIYGGSPALYAHAASHVRLVRSAVRGTAAPWSSRASLKYRGSSPYLIVVDSKLPRSEHWEIGYDELTDGHDGIVVDSLKTLRFHHNLVDNFNDDALYLVLAPRASVPEDVQIYENLITRTYTALAFADDDGKPNAIGPGVHIFRNVFDLRVGTYGWIAKDAQADTAQAALIAGRMCGDHGSPTWEPLNFYNNTVILAGKAWRDYYGAGMIMGTKGTQRGLYDNIFVQVEGDPGVSFQGTAGDNFLVDGNLMWGLASKPDKDFFMKRMPSYPPGSGFHDQFADPRFVSLKGAEPAIDLRLQPGSPAIDAGVGVPKGWPDTLRALDRGKPDLGALPLGAPMLRVGPAAAPAAPPPAPSPARPKKE